MRFVFWSNRKLSECDKSVRIRESYPFKFKLQFAILHWNIYLNGHNNTACLATFIKFVKIIDGLKGKWERWREREGKREKELIVRIELVTMEKWTGRKSCIGYLTRGVESTLIHVLLSVLLLSKSCHYKFLQLLPLGLSISHY